MLAGEGSVQRGCRLSSRKDRVPMREAGCGLRVAVRVETSLEEGDGCAWHLHAGTCEKRAMFLGYDKHTSAANPRHARGAAISRWHCILLLVPRPRVTRGGMVGGSGTWWDGEWHGAWGMGHGDSTRCKIELQSGCDSSQPANCAKGIGGEGRRRRKKLYEMVWEHRKVLKASVVQDLDVAGDGLHGTLTSVEQDARWKPGAKRIAGRVPLQA
ncbi:hypothetical protein B0T18DRAFT_489744 [Schizothecium vesticola]|uniref:Uncharacterized protein n=1 Tax=Schizothecium vesticola TaxID=314040 RepID=A0AA40K1S5_9PEZI|nr:hypothetical protein B0T18DRAFT_489744 [Schizothecium vesticola]